MEIVMPSIWEVVMPDIGYYALAGALAGATAGVVFVNVARASIPCGTIGGAVGAVFSYIPSIVLGVVGHLCTGSIAVFDVVRGVCSVAGVILGIDCAISLAAKPLKARTVNVRRNERALRFDVPMNSPYSPRAA